MTRALGVAQALGRGSVDIGVRERLLELRDGGAKERRIPLERLLFERDLVDRGHELSLFTAHFERQARNAARRRPVSPASTPSAQIARQASPWTRTRPRACSRRRRRPRLRRAPPPRSAGVPRLERRIKKVASPSSIVRPTRIATMPQPVGRTKSASAMETMRADLVDDQDRRPDRDVVEQPGRVRRSASGCSRARPSSRSTPRRECRGCRHRGR